MTVTPNFNFDGRCQEAIALYQKAFGAQVLCLLRYADAAPKDLTEKLAAVPKDWVYHAQLQIGDQRMMLADNPEIPFQPGLALSLVVTFGTQAEAQAAYDALEEGGTVLYPPHGSTYCSWEAVLVDRFGFRWGLMTDHA
ncbi:MAG: VOC family protein [Eubacteriales bacterium]|nr:VOC family protein [Eubacteriales bacterium]